MTKEEKKKTLEERGLGYLHEWKVMVAIKLTKGTLSRKRRPWEEKGQEGFLGVKPNKTTVVTGERELGKKEQRKKKKNINSRGRNSYAKHRF